MHTESSDSLATLAAFFAGLGDVTRLSIIARLSAGEPHSISQLTGTTDLTRQAVTKHLRVLEAAGIVSSIRIGRESRFRLEPAAIDDARDYLEQVSAASDSALARPKKFVET